MTYLQHYSQLSCSQRESGTSPSISQGKIHHGYRRLVRLFGIRPTRRIGRLFNGYSRDPQVSPKCCWLWPLFLAQLGRSVERNYALEFIVPAITHENIRYYILGKGGLNALAIPSQIEPRSSALWCSPTELTYGLLLTSKHYPQFEPRSPTLATSPSNAVPISTMPYAELNSSECVVRFTSISHDSSQFMAQAYLAANSARKNSSGMPNRRTLRCRLNE